MTKFVFGNQRIIMFADFFLQKKGAILITFYNIAKNLNNNTMATTNKKQTGTKTTKKTTAKSTTTTKPKDNAKRRLIISYDKLPEKDKELFEETYSEDLMDHVQTVTRPDGTPMFVVPLETDENVYMVKLDLKVDNKITTEDFDKDLDDDDKDSTITSLENVDNGGNKAFNLKHGDYSSLDSLEESIAKEDMDDANFTSLDDVDVADDSSLDL